MPLGKRKQREEEVPAINKVTNKNDDETEEFQQQPSASLASSSSDRRIIIVLDLAALETVKTKKGDFQLLNCDDHIPLIKKFNKDPQNHRPDIIHQELMAVLDSPLNKAGMVSLYMRSDTNVLVEINPKTRIPRTFKRFSGLMVQLLNKLKIRSSDGNDMLLKVIKNPISRHLPAGAVCYGFSHTGTLYSPAALAEKVPDNTPVVLVFGAQAVRGINETDHPYIQEMISISEYPLSGVVAVNRVLGAIENHWGIV